jgi:hypothetical protein
MTQVTGYDTVEEMFAHIDANRRIADAQAKDWQKEIRAGDYYAQWVPELGFPIFGKILEDDYTGALKHFRFTFAFSDACPAGESGDVHVSAITTLLDEAAFIALYKKLNNNQAPPV